jgi:hypothetical protein
MPESLDRTLKLIVDSEVPRLRLMQQPDASAIPTPGKWSKKEVLGHLIDSASNNHQRFVRAQLSNELAFPGYAQNDWVRVQGYADAEWQEIVDLWSVLNRHLAYIVERIPSDRLLTHCSIGGSAPVTLEALILDYIRHTEHHLKQLK